MLLKKNLYLKYISVTIMAFFENINADLMFTVMDYTTGKSQESAN